VPQFAPIRCDRILIDGVFVIVLLPCRGARLGLRKYPVGSPPANFRQASGLERLRAGAGACAQRLGFARTSSFKFGQISFDP